MDVLLIILWPLGYFVRNPMLCGLLAATFTVPVFVPIYRLRSRVTLACCAAAWWFFCSQEALRPEESDVVADLLRYGPLYLLALIAGAWGLVSGHRPEGAPLRPSWRTRQRLRRRT